MNADLIRFLEEMQPLTSFIGAILGIASLGFIARLYLMARAAQEERIKAVVEQKKTVEERLRTVESDSERTAAWQERKIQDLKDQLYTLMEKEGITTHNLSIDTSFIENLKADIQEGIESVLKEITQLEEDSVPIGGHTEDPERNLTLAKASTIVQEWQLAAEHYGEYLKHNISNWEVHFLRGVAYANSRRGPATDLEGLRAYNEAISFCPFELEHNMKARMHTYRAALLKRLNRLEEAESDILLAQEWASEPYEVTDALYNLACIYSLKRDKKKMMEQLKKLSEHSGNIAFLTSKPYFDYYKNDPDFIKATTNI